LKKGRIIGILTLVVLLASLLSVQRGYGVKSEFPSPTISGLIESVSNPSGECLNLGLKGWYGTVTITLSRLWIYLRNAKPNSTYIIWVGYVQTGGLCKGTWLPVGSVSTDETGEGISVQWFYPSGSYSYCVFEFKDSAGNLVYATHVLSF